MHQLTDYPPPFADDLLWKRDAVDDGLDLAKRDSADKAKDYDRYHGEGCNRYGNNYGDYSGGESPFLALRLALRRAFCIEFIR